MKQRLGALLCLALGAVLIFNGVASGTGVTVGGPAPDCGTPVVGVIVPACPTGTIKFTETTQSAQSNAATRHDAQAPATWSVHVTSKCLDPTSGTAVDQTVSVPNNGSASTTSLFIWSNPDHQTQCSYTYTVTAVAGFTTSFDPVSPGTITFTAAAPSVLAVALTAVPVAPTSSAPASSSAAPSTSAVASTTSAAPTSSAPALSETGPREQVRASLYIGIALCLLGIALLFGGRIPRRRARHTA